MIDLRFLLFLPNIPDGELLVTEAVKLFHEVNEYRSVLETAIQKWWRTIYKEFNEHKGYEHQYPSDVLLDLIEKQPKPSTHLNQTIPKNLLNIVDNIDKAVSRSTGYSSTASAWVSKVLVAMSVAKETALHVEPSQIAVHLAMQVGHFYFLPGLFADSFSASLQDDRKLREMWVKVLCVVSGDLAFYFNFNLITEYEVDSLRELPDKWKANQFPFDEAWKAHRQEDYVPLRERQLSSLEVLRAIDLGKWVLALEKLPLPGIIDNALSAPSIVRDKTTIIEAIRRAPQLVSRDGEYTGHPVILFLVKSILLHASEVHEILRQARDMCVRPEQKGRKADLEQQISTYENLEAPRWFDSAFTELNAREDGKWVSFALILDFMRRNNNQRLLGVKRTWSPDSEAKKQLMHELLKYINWVRHARFFGQWQERVQASSSSLGTGLHGKRNILSEADGEGARQSVSDGFTVLSTASLLFVEGHERSLAAIASDTDNFSELWNWYIELLIKRDCGIDRYLNPLEEASGLGEIIEPLAYILLGQKEPVSGWNEVWHQLSSQRRRAMHWMRFEDYSPITTSALHILVGNWACDIGIALCANKGGDQSIEYETILNLWEAIFNGARWLVLAAPIDGRDLGVTSLMHCIARIPGLEPLFSTRDDFLEWASTCVQMLGRDPRALALGAINLLNNGMGKREVEQIIQGSSIGMKEIIAYLEEYYDEDSDDALPLFFVQLRSKFIDSLSSHSGAQK